MVRFTIALLGALVTCCALGAPLPPLPVKAQVQHCDGRKDPLTPTHLDDGASEILQLSHAGRSSTANHQENERGDKLEGQVSGRSLSAQATPPQELRICSVVHSAIMSIPMFTTTWAHANRARYLARGVNVTAKLIGTTEDLPWATKAARAVVQETPNCDAFFGTGLSSVAHVAAVVVSKIWMDSASAASFSDKTQYPFFNRVYVDSRQDGVVGASVIRSLGVTAVHTLCSDDSYGRSATEGFSATASGFTIVSRRCYLASATKAELKTIVQSIATQQHRSHWVYLAVTFTLFPALFEAVHEAGLNQTLTFIGSRCSGATQYPGMLCVTPTLNDTRALEGFAARDSDIPFRTQVLSDFVTYGATSTAGALIDFKEATTIIDGVELLVDAYVKFKEANPAIAKVSDHQAALRDFMRANVSSPIGVFGSFTLDPKGDRVIPSFNVLNAAKNKTLVSVGSYNRATSELSLTADIYLPAVGAVGLPLRTIVPIEESSSSTSVVLWVLIGFAALLLILGGLVAVAFLLRTPGSARNVADAPTDEALPFAVVFTDIQASTTLWAQLPTLMGPALDAHNSIIRAEIRKHHGYEVKTIGDSFMVAFKSVVDAAKFAVDVQESLRTHDWETTEFDQLYAVQAAKDGRPAAAVIASGPWNGLRVRVGMSHGIGKVAFDEISKGYDYFGTVVNTAARVEGVAHGGQVLLAEPAYEALSEALSSTPDALPGHAFEDLGPQPLRGLSDPVGLYQWRPKAGPMAQRTYPPLRLDVENVVNEGDVIGDSHSEADAGSVLSSNIAGGPRTTQGVSLYLLAKAAVANGPRFPKTLTAPVTDRRKSTPRPGYPSTTAVPAWGTTDHHASDPPSDGPATGRHDGTEAVKERYAPAEDLTIRLNRDDAGAEAAEEEDPAAASLQQSYVELVALLRPAMAKKEQRAVFEKVAKAWRVQDPTMAKATRHLAQDRESKLALMLMGAMLKGKASAAAHLSV